MTAHVAEVIVVGAGPAGAALATFLARAGVAVCLADRAHFPRDKPCAEYLSPQASRLLAELEVLDRVERAGAVALTGMKVTSPGGITFTGDFAAAHGYRGFRDAGLAVRRTVLDTILVQRAREAGVDVREGATIRNIVRDGDCVTGVDVECDGATTTWRAPLIVGADGIRSQIARRLGVARRLPWPTRYALVAHYTGVAGMELRGEMLVGHGAYCGLAPVGADIVNVALVARRSLAREMRGQPEAFLERWIAAHPDLRRRFAAASRVSPVLATGPFAVRARRVNGTGAALVGDAMEFFDPFTGEGIYAALRGAELLTPYAFEAVRADSRDRHRVALDAWHRAHASEFRGKRRVEELIGAAVGMPSVFDHVARALARQPAMADLLVGVAGDFVPPRMVLRPGFLGRLLLPRPGPMDNKPTAASRPA